MPDQPGKATRHS